jgi:hypothetical protein
MQNPILATLNDADITLNLEAANPGFRVHAVRSDSVSEPVTVLDKECTSLGEAIKAITVFYASEWESIFITARISTKLERAITAS